MPWMSTRSCLSHMREYKILFVIIVAVLAMAGCAEIPLKDGELVVGKDTTAGIDDIGVGHLSNKF